MTDVYQPDDDELDGCCDLDFDNGPEVTDELAPYVVLFASDLDPQLHERDHERLLRHAQEWHDLFDRPVT